MLDRREFLKAAFVTVVTPQFIHLSDAPPVLPPVLQETGRDYEWDIREQVWRRVRWLADEMGRNWVEVYEITGEMLEDQGIHLECLIYKDRDFLIDQLIEEHRHAETDAKGPAQAGGVHPHAGDDVGGGGSPEHVHDGSRALRLPLSDRIEGGEVGGV